MILTRKTAGFTLIELLVVVAILGLLISIVLPAYNNIRQAAWSTSSHAFLMELHNGAEQFFSDHRYYPGQDDASRTVLNNGTQTGTFILAKALFGLDDDFIRLDSPKEYAPYRPDYVRDGAIFDRFPEGIAKPILYYPARVGRSAINDIYRLDDNAAYAEALANSGDFYDFITDPRPGIGAGSRPYRPDSFLLFGAGVDRNYFTDDDNLNFNRN